MNDRIERLKTDAAELNVTSSGRRDGLYQTIGAVCMVVGVVGAFIAYQMSLGKEDNRDIQSLVILAITMLTLAVAGAALFMRYSLARFLRFWLLRQLVEGQAHIDQLVEAVGPRQVSSPPPGEPVAAERAGAAPADTPASLDRAST
jgi:hypothetical protein